MASRRSDADPSRPNHPDIGYAGYGAQASEENNAAESGILSGNGAERNLVRTLNIPLLKPTGKTACPSVAATIVAAEDSGNSLASHMNCLARSS
jgi:hypothetical protein